jgi:hypothetical protein
MKTQIIILLFFLTELTAFSQNSSDPPPASMPTEKNKPLIDNLISESRFNDFFKKYCTTRITRIGKDKNWTEDKIQQTIEKLDYEDFKHDLYNYFSLFSNHELKATTKQICDLNKNHNNSPCFIMTTSVLLNLDLRIESILKEK